MHANQNEYSFLSILGEINSSQDSEASFAIDVILEEIQKWFF